MADGTHRVNLGFPQAGRERQRSGMRSPFSCTFRVHMCSLGASGGGRGVLEDG
jgi:hypothetical protein